MPARNSPFDRSTPVEVIIQPVQTSASFMASIRSFEPPPGSLAIWFLGQNGFLLKERDGPLIAIDLYLTDSCAAKFAHLPYRLNRQLPVFIEPEDLDVDFFLTTHSHDDHADPETLARMRREKPIFVGPFDSVSRYLECGVAKEACRLIHPGQELNLDSSTSVSATFALPTDSTDLNHVGYLIRFSNGITFYDSGDTAYSERLPCLLPSGVDICAICINGGFHNLSPQEAASVVNTVRPRVAIPCHYDMMVNNLGLPEMFRVALENLHSQATFTVLEYYKPWVYRKP
ncbi:MAG: MBL fold metallo-hydrolase [Candidatus Sulfotelmatobacter sp.]|jgi:L-ascorbate 6-phosphate lactonase